MAKSFRSYRESRWDDAEYDDGDEGLSKKDRKLADRKAKQRNKLHDRDERMADLEKPEPKRGGK